MPAEMVAREGAIGRSIFLVFSGVIKVMLPRPVRGGCLYGTISHLENMHD